MFTLVTVILFIMLMREAKNYTVLKSDHHTFGYVLVSLLFADVCGFWVNVLTECTDGAVYCVWAYIPIGLILLIHFCSLETIVRDRQDEL